MRTSGVMVGLAIGDALGMPFETLDETVHPDLATWDGSFRPGTFHDLPAGHTTDDTAMAMCLAESLIAQLHQRGTIIDGDDFDGADVASRYLQWSVGTPHGMGGTTRTAMQRLASGIGWRASGVSFENGNDVGSAPPMRAAPIGIAAAVAPMFDLPSVCWRDAYITHAHPEARAASIAVALTVALALQDRKPGDILRRVHSVLGEHCADTWVRSDIGDVRVHLQNVRVVTDSAGSRVYPQPADWIVRREGDTDARLFSRRGNARSIVSTALYCGLAYDNFRDGITAAVRLGGDTDTRGAIAGAILGARFGMLRIPDEYLAGVKDVAQLAALGADMESAVLGSRKRT